MSASGFMGLEWGVHHARVYESPDQAMTIGRFGFAGCIDAPDVIPAGGHRSEWWPEVDEHIPTPIEVQREGKSEKA